MTLVEFLRARLDEDEAFAEAANYEGQAWHEPSKAFAEIAAKRAIVEWCGERDQIWVGTIASDPELPKPSEFVPGRLTNPEGSMVLRLLAAVHKDHPDYSDDWAPT